MRTRLSGWVGAAGALCLASTAWAQAGAGDGAATAPTTLTYQVQRGDTLYALAAAYLIRPSDYRIIQRLNGVQAPRRLQVGRSLTLPVNLLKTAPEQAVVTSYRGAVQIDTGQGLATPRQGQAVGEGSLVVTGANAFVRLTLSDNSHMVVPSNSRVRLSRLRRYLINDALDHGLTVERGRLATDAGLVDAFAETDSADGSTRLDFGPLADGLYYLRLTALSEAGIEGQGTVYSLIRVNNSLGNLSARPQGDPRLRGYRFRWEDTSGKDAPPSLHAAPTAGSSGPPPFYRFVLHRLDEAGQPVGPTLVDRSGLQDDNINLTALANGVYGWRVQVSRLRYERLIETWSEPQTLHIGQ